MSGLQVLEAELQAQEALYHTVLERGQTLLSNQSRVHQRTAQRWVRTLEKQWSQLVGGAAARRHALQAALSISQVQTGASGQHRRSGSVLKI